MKYYAVVYGNPSDGFEYRGVFSTMQEAADWADELNANDPWWVVTINPK